MNVNTRREQTAREPVGTLSLSSYIGTGDLGDAVGFHRRTLAAGADSYSLHPAVDHQALAVHIGLEIAVGAPLREANIMPKRFGLPANLTLPGHGNPLSLIHS